jgi:peroxiredoxin
MPRIPALFKRRGSMFAALVLIALFTAAAIWWLPFSGPRPAPAVSFTLLDGGTRSLAELRGRPVLVSFWSKADAASRAELDALAALAREPGARGLELIAVAAAYDDPAAVRALAAQAAFPFALALDPDAAAARAFGGVPVVPAAFLVDRDGYVVYSQVGRLDLARVRRLVAPPG